MTREWRKGSMTWGKRIVFVALFIVGTMYAVLSMAERSKDSLRKGLEDYLAKSTGQYAEITEMTDAKLVPDIRFDMKGISIRDRGDSDKVYVHAKSASIGLPLWRMVFGGGGVFRTFVIEDMQIATGYALPKKLHFDFVGITDPDPQSSPAQFVLEGEYNDRALLSTIEIVRKATKKGPVYSLATKSLASFKLGGTEAHGLVSRGLFNVSLQAGLIRSGGIGAEFIAEGLHERPINIDIAITTGDARFNAVLTGSDDNILLTVTPDGNVGEDGKAAMKRLVDSMMVDLGVTDENSGFKIDMTALLPSSSSTAISTDNGQE